MYFALSNAALAHAQAAPQGTAKDCSDESKRYKSIEHDDSLRKLHDTPIQRIEQIELLLNWPFIVVQPDYPTIVGP